MNPLVFFRLKVNKDPQFVSDEVKNIAQIMHVKQKIMELDFYQFKEVSYGWVTLWKKGRGKNLGKINLDVFQTAFPDRLILHNMSEAMVEEFINLGQGFMQVKKYYLKFTQLAKYALKWITYSSPRISKFVTKVSDLVIKKCRTTMLIGDIDIAQLQTYFQQIKAEKLKGK